MLDFGLGFREKTHRILEEQMENVLPPGVAMGPCYVATKPRLHTCLLGKIFVFAQSGGFSLLRAHPEEMHYAWPLHLDFLARQVVLPRIMRGERNAKR